MIFSDKLEHAKEFVRRIYPNLPATSVEEIALKICKAIPNDPRQRSQNYPSP